MNVIGGFCFFSIPAGHLMARGLQLKNFEPDILTQQQALDYHYSIFSFHAGNIYMIVRIMRLIFYSRKRRRPPQRRFSKHRPSGPYARPSQQQRDPVGTFTRRKPPSANHGFLWPALPFIENPRPSPQHLIRMESPCGT